MQEIGSQLILKWARFGEERKIDVAADFTRFTFDTIALLVLFDSLDWQILANNPKMRHGSTTQQFL